MCNKGLFVLQDDKNRFVKCSVEYIGAALESLNIVGSVDGGQMVNSPQNGHGRAYFFDAGPEAEADQRKKVAREQMGPAGQALGHSFENNSPLLDLLGHNPRATPETVVGAASQVEGFEPIFAADTGVWEGYTLAEHTETVLRNYERSFAGDLPAEIHAPLKLALLTHDIGKPEVADRDPKNKIDEYNNNLVRSQQFLEQIGVGQAGITYIHGLFEAVGKYANTYIHYDSDSFDDVRSLGRDTLLSIGVEPTPDSIEGFLEATSILFACDGGAYTSMATTRMPDGSQYRNYPEYNDSFKTPSDSRGFEDRTQIPSQKIRHRPGIGPPGRPTRVD